MEKKYCKKNGAWKKRGGGRNSSDASRFIDGNSGKKPALYCIRFEGVAVVFSGGNYGQIKLLLPISGRRRSNPFVVREN